MVHFPDDSDLFNPFNDSSLFVILIPFNNDKTTVGKINLETYDKEFGEKEWNEEEWNNDEDSS
ncbi:7448_t:CDS:2 [Funneliformis geosporum]|uniref:7448_t:CDS:1 n=1 Tax=Funneliformis geosporum TaxID=1117311 RepID=A0A9W4WTR1_9GLOM|nr:7448_t:CDS:2 [Funneliformis geosporum]